MGLQAREAAIYLWLFDADMKLCMLRFLFSVAYKMVSQFTCFWRGYDLGCYIYIYVDVRPLLNKSKILTMSSICCDLAVS